MKISADLSSLPFSALFSFRRDSLRTRLMVWNMLTLALILALVGGLIQYTAQRSLLGSIDRDLRNNQPPARNLTGDRLEDIRRAVLPDGLARKGPHGPSHKDPNGPDAAEPGPPPAPNDAPAPPDGQSPPQPDAENDPNRAPKPEGDASPEPSDSTDANGASDSETPQTADWHRPLVFTAQGTQIFKGGFAAPASLAGFRAALSSGRAVYADGTLYDEPARLLYNPLRFQGRVIAVKQSAYPMTEVRRTLGVMRGALLTLIPVALLLAGLGGAWLTDRALRPVRQITFAAERIGADDLSRRLPTQGDDEFARLAATFNGMLSRLESDFAQREALVLQLRELVAQQQRFTGDASHELRTPLTVIKANSSLLLSAQPTAGEWREGMEEINAAADSMTRLAQDLLLLTRGDGGQMGRSVETLALEKVLRQAVQRVRRPDAAPISLEADSTLTLQGNAEELTRLFCNLLENAQRHTPPDGTIQVVAERRGEQIAVRVIDSGAGIAPEHLPHLCERFYRVDSARSRPDGGAGLGLAICKSIVEANGGTLAFASVVGKGTTVTVLLPAAIGR